MKKKLLDGAINVKADSKSLWSAEADLILENHVW
jgi:hypothetical protein